MDPNIEETIGRVEQLYASITGHPPPQGDGTVARIPPEIDPARHVEEQLAKLLGAVEQQLARRHAPPAVAWQPRAAAWQDEGSYEIAIDVPGVTRESLDVSSDGHVVIVRGHRAAPWSELARAPIAAEVAFGAFERTFALPTRVEPTQIHARLEDGVLRVRVARVSPTKPTAIAVQV